jgi:anti-sigma factor (TIGR02949 family)
MNCREAGKFLYAFADGELETRDNLQVLEHINMCIECCGKVSIQQQLRGAVAAAFREEAVPASLRDRIASSIAAETLPADEPSPIYRLWRSVAMAAVITIAAIGIWNVPQRLPGAGQGVVAGVQFTDSTDMAGILADNVYAMHCRCAAAGEKHQHADLPNRGLDAAKAMSRELECPILRCTTLDANPDTVFVSANFCGLSDCSGAIHSGGHLIYRFEDGPLKGRAISLISVTRLGEMDNLKKLPMGDREYCIIKPTRAKGDATVVLFNCPKASHLVVLEATPDETLRFVQDMRPLSPEHAENTATPGELVAATGY